MAYYRCKRGCKDAIDEVRPPAPCGECPELEEFARRPEAFSVADKDRNMECIVYERGEAIWRGPQRFDGR
jgi:hypothetical protein